MTRAPELRTPKPPVLRKCGSDWSYSDSARMCGNDWGYGKRKVVFLDRKLNQIEGPPLPPVFCGSISK